MSDTAAIEGTLKGMKTLADKTFRLTVDVDERQRDALFSMFDQDAPVAIARLQDSAKPKEYGQFAKRLKLSGFFRVPDVWKACGTDSDYQDWCRRRVCAVCGGQDWVEEEGEGRCEAAHVRRAGESGTAFRAEYATIPLCHKCHHLQHTQGEKACLDSCVDSWSEEMSVEEVSAWFDKQRISHIEQWVWERLREDHGADSMKHVPPDSIAEWARSRGVANYLPSEFHAL